MFGEEKNLKDSNTNLGIVVKDSNAPVSYTKTDKLITALYMVTDVMDKEEPIRNKLRTLGTSIVSDIYLIQQNCHGHMAPNTVTKISETMSFLDIAETVNLISGMNASILRKEFFELKKAIEGFFPAPEPLVPKVSLSELFQDDFSLPSASMNASNEKDKMDYKGHTRIGVQKGSTLMRALRKVNMSDRIMMSDRVSVSDRKTNEGFELLRKQRREEIMNIIKTSPNGATITDIKTKIAELPAQAGSLVSCGEKTLQRELVGMLKDGVLKKTGEKRWSRYFLH